MTKKRKKKIVALAVAAAVLVALFAWTAWGNTALELNTYTLTGHQLPDAFDGYRIAHISDLHNAEMGADNERLLSMLREAEPDMIAISGDLIDARNTNIDVALRFAEEAMKIAPCYYVTGNHEARISNYDKLSEGLTELGVVLLNNEKRRIENGGEAIAVAGVADPSFHFDDMTPSETAVDRALDEIIVDSNEYTILLSHRPELFKLYVEKEIDLVLSGHAHGGQFRLPFIGGLLAPNQGLFPKYDAGLYSEDNTNMIVSRGLGNSAFPFRFNNRPEVIILELQSI